MTVHLVAAGTCSIDATQAGNAFYLAAPTVTRAFVVLATATSIAPTSIGRGAINFPISIVGAGFAPGSILGISGRRDGRHDHRH